MKKSIAFVLSVIFAFLFVSCGKEKAEMYCYNCGKGAAKSDSFCSACGVSIKNIGDNNSVTIIETTTEQETTTKPEPTTVVTTIPTTKENVTKKKVTSSTAENLGTSFDVYKIAAAGLETISRYVAAPSSVRIESATYDPNMDADGETDFDVTLYCTYTNKTGGLNGIKCHVLLWSTQPPDVGLYERIYKLNDSLYVGCLILDDVSSAPDMFSYHKKLNTGKIQTVNQQVDWGKIEVFQMSRYY